VESDLYKGTAVLCRAVRKILSAKEAPKRLKCVLEISDKGIKMMDKSKAEVTGYESIARTTTIIVTQTNTHLNWLQYHPFSKLLSDV
jgi:hypothetical protein